MDNLDIEVLINEGLRQGKIPEADADFFRLALRKTEVTGSGSLPIYNRIPFGLNGWWHHMARRSDVLPRGVIINGDFEYKEGVKAKETPRFRIQVNTFEEFFPSLEGNKDMVEIIKESYVAHGNLYSLLLRVDENVLYYKADIIVPGVNKEQLQKITSWSDATRRHNSHI